MIVLDSLESIPPLPKPIALTIGTFDGVHLGHQFLLQELKQRGFPVVLTFSNHPLEILQPKNPPSLLMPLSNKLALLQKYDVAATLVLPFTQELAKTPYDQFLQDLHTSLAFSTLVLGEDAKLGARAEGNAAAIEKLSKIIGFEAVFLSKMKIDGEIVSSRRIREWMQNDQTDKASKWLGHPPQK